MLYKRSYHSPLGEMAMISDGKGLTVLSFRGQKYDKAEKVKDITVSLETRGERGKVISESREEKSVCAVFERTAEWLDIYFSGHDPGFIPPLSAKGTPFQEEVWDILKKIPYGEVTSYGEIARQIAEKRGIKRMSAQAVGGAVGRNPIAIIVPCHRVVGSNGNLTGYAGGLDKKAELLRVERGKFMN